MLIITVFFKCLQPKTKTLAGSMILLHVMNVPSCFFCLRIIPSQLVNIFLVENKLIF